MSCCITHSVPRTFEPCRVVIADHGLLFAFGRRPSAPIRRAVGKAPAKKELKIHCLARINGFLQTQNAHRVGDFGLSAEVAALRKLVPEQQRRIPPASGRPTAPILPYIPRTPR